MRRIDLLLSNTLQPISSDAGGNSNDFGSSSVFLSPPGFKKSGTNQSDSNQPAVLKNTVHSDSALVQSYIEEVNNQT